VSSREGRGARCCFGGVGGSVTLSGAQVHTGTLGFIMSNPDESTMAVHSYGLIMTCSEERNDIPKIRGIGNSL